MPSLAVTECLHLQPGERNLECLWHGFSIVECFTILSYDRNSNQLNINHAHLEWVIHKKRKRDVAYTPTKDALVQHLTGAVYQGEHCWGQAFEVAPTWLETIVVNSSTFKPIPPWALELWLQERLPGKTCKSSAQHCVNVEEAVKMEEEMHCHQQRNLSRTELQNSKGSVFPFSLTMFSQFANNDNYQSTNQIKTMHETCNQY